jgi:peptide/nickel transport system substrate-binding protein
MDAHRSGLIKRVSRRRLLAATGVVVFASAVAACAGAPATPTAAPAAPTRAPAPTAPPAAPPTAAPASPTVASAAPTAGTTPAAAQAPVAVVTSAAGTTGAASKDTINIARGGNLRTVDPHGVVGLYEGELLAHVYESLARFKPGTLDVEGVLAEKWTQSEDGLTWTFNIKKGIKFQNGEDVTADAWKATYDRIFKTTDGNAYNSINGKMDPGGIKAIDPNTIAFTMKLAYPSIALVPPAFASAISPKAMKDDPDHFWEKPGAGSGPYTLVSWTRDSFQAVRNDTYRDPKLALIKNLKYRVILEPATKVAALKNSEVDVIDQVPFEQVAGMQSGGKFQIVQAKTTDGMHLNLNCGKDPFKRDEARMAAMYAVDRDALVKDVLGGSGEVIAQPSPKGYLGYNANLKPYPYDPEKSKQLLQQAGLTLPVPIQLISPDSWFPKNQEIVQAVAAQMNQAGFQVDLKIMEGGAFTAGRRSSGYDAAYMQLGFGVDPDPNVYSGRIIDDYWGSQFDKLPMSKPVFDKIVAARTERDPKKRDQLYQDIEAALYEKGPRVLLYRNVYIWGLLPRVKNMTLWESTYNIFGASIEG